MFSTGGLVGLSTLRAFVATQLGYKVLWNISIKEPRNTGFRDRMIGYFFSLSVKASILRCSGLKLSYFIFSERYLHIPNFFIWSSIMPDRQVKWGFWCVHFHWPVTAEFFVKTDRTSRCIGGINLWLESSLVSSLLTLSGLCASLGQPNQDLLAIILLLKLNVTPE